MTVDNNSGKPLAVRYNEFVIQSGAEQYAAIPPFDVTGSTYASLLTQPDEEGGHFQDVSWNVASASQPGSVASKPAVAASAQQPDPDHDRDIDHPAHRQVMRHDYEWRGYYVAPWWGYSYPGIGFWSSPWGPPDLGYYNEYYPYMQKVQLPTESMLRKAIPEGVIADGGDVTGFLYFQPPKVNDNEQGLTFKVKLIDAKTNQQFGTIEVPFIAKKR